MKGRTAHNYKNPNLVPDAVAILIRELRNDRNQLLAALKLVWSDTNARFGRDPVSNMPLSEIIGSAIRNVEANMSPNERERLEQNISDMEDAESASNQETT